MKRIIMMLTVAAMMVTALTVTSAGAFAASSEQECEDSGGTFTRTQGTASCEYPPVITESKNDNPKFQKSSQTTETGQGNLDNKEEDTPTNTCTKPCPPGQFK